VPHVSIEGAEFFAAPKVRSMGSSLAKRYPHSRGVCGNFAAGCEI